MGLTLVTPPAAEPASLDEAKEWLAIVDDTSRDTQIGALIKAATRHLEAVLGLSLIERTWELTLNAFSDEIELPRGPVTSVTSVKYLDAEGVEQTLAAGGYSVDLASRQQRIVRNSDATWPATFDRVNAVTVTYVAGFDTLPAIYEDMKTAILMLVASWFANREAVNVGNIVTPMPHGVEALIQPYRRILL